MLVKITSIIAATAVIILIILCAITPERDKFGNYTQPVQYWCNDTYFNTHF